MKQVGSGVMACDNASAEGSGGFQGKDVAVESNVALILGVTGIVGTAMLQLLMNPKTAGYPWKVYGVAKRPQPSWLTTGVPHSDSGDGPSSFQYVQCDLLEREETLKKLSALRDVTHIFYMTWVMAGATEEDNVDANGRMYRNTLDAVAREGGPLQHIALQTGGKYYIGPFSAGGKLSVPELPFREDAPRRPGPNFYYTQMDMTLEAVEKSGGKLTWSEHRPTGIFGFAPRNLMNFVGTLATCALICKEEGIPFAFPGNRFTHERLVDCSDAVLIAEQQVWAATTPAAKNQSFNVTNGDVMTWKTVWHRVAERFGLEVPEYRGTGYSLAELMKDKGPTWDAIVKKYGLEPTKVEEVGHWWFVDTFFNMTFEIVLSMNKSRKFGFLGWRDTEESLLAALDDMKRHNIIP